MRAATPSLAQGLFVSCCVLLFVVPGASAQTLSQVAAGHSSCTTFGGEGISAQLVAVQQCLRPGQFVSFDDANITATSPRVHLVAQASAAAAIQAAAASIPLMINSGFRPLSDQYLLWASGECSVVATPGSSNHQSGRAIDVNNWAAAQSTLEAQGCVWFGASDAVHFDCPGVDLRSDSVFTFQRLWNINNPGSPLDEDGVWGPMTQAALASSPAAGFALGGLTTCGPCAGGAELNACGMCGATPAEVCGGGDEDCDMMVDEGVTNACGGCGPVPAEVCGGGDEDCDMMVDEGCPGPDMGVETDVGTSQDGGSALVDADVDTDAAVDTDGGAAEVDQSVSRPVSGSSCAANAPGPTSTWPAVFVLAALALRRRRR